MCFTINIINKLYHDFNEINYIMNLIKKISFQLASMEKEKTECLRTLQNLSQENETLRSCNQFKNDKVRMRYIRTKIDNSLGFTPPQNLVKMFYEDS